MRTTQLLRLNLDNTFVDRISEKEKSVLSIILRATFMSGFQAFSIPFSSIADSSDFDFSSQSANHFLRNVIRFALEVHETNNSQTKKVLFPLFEKISLELAARSLHIYIHDSSFELISKMPTEEKRLWCNLKTILDLRSKYSPELLFLLQNSHGTLEFDFADFRRKLSFPESYPTASIIEKVESSIDELNRSGLVEDLSYEKEYGSGRGRPLERISFYFERVTSEKTELPHLTEIQKPILSKLNYKDPQVYLETSYQCPECKRGKLRIRIDLAGRPYYVCSNSEFWKYGDCSCNYRKYNL